MELCRSLDGLPLAIELAAARTKTLSVEEITRRLDEPLPRADATRPAAGQNAAGRSGRRSPWSYDLLFPDDQRGLWALATFAGGAPLPAVESVLEALDVPAAAAIDVVGRLASRSLVIVDDLGAPPTSGGSSPEAVAPTRYRLLDSIRAFALEAMADGRAGRTRARRPRRLVRRGRGLVHGGVRSAHQAEHLLLARTERANIDAALAWSATHDPRLALSIVNGFGWAWVVLGDSRGAQRILAALEASRRRRAARERAGALLLAAWIEASTGHLELARGHIAAAKELADATGDVDLQARCSYYLAYVVSHHGEFRTAMELTDRSRALYDGLDRPWDQAANGLFAARAAISAGDEGRSVDAVDRVRRWLRDVDDPWLHVRGEAMLGELARLQHRFDDAVLHIGRAAETSGRLGFQQTEAYQVSSLGRAQCQAGDYDRGLATLELAIDKAEATGDVRLAALARVHLGRVLRALGDLAAGAGRARSCGKRGTATPAAASRPRSASACWPPSTPRTMSPAPRAPPKRSSTTPGATATPPSRSSPSTRWLASQQRAATPTRHATCCDAADRRMVAASHFITERRPGRRPLGQADRLNPRPARPDFAGPASRRAAAPRSCRTRKASRPPMAIAMPSTCRSRSVSPSNRNDQTTARAGWTTCAIPMVPIWIVLCANTNSPCAATPVRNVSSNVYAHPVPLIPNTRHWRSPAEAPRPPRSG